MTPLQASVQPAQIRPQMRFDQVALKATLGSHYVLKAIAFSIMAGDRLAIVGPSGAGKTSLLRLMNRLSDPSEGTIFYDNRPLMDYPLPQLRQTIPLVLQEPHLLDMEVRQALIYPLTLRGMATQDIEQRLDYWTERLHLSKDWFNRTAVQLSVGQRQLVAIARSLMIKPRFLLLDEPTAALDIGRRSHLVDTLIDYSQTRPCTIVMVSHDLDIAQQFCSKLLYLANGQQVQHLSASEVNWAALKEHLIQAEKAQQAEWDDDDD